MEPFNNVYLHITAKRVDLLTGWLLYSRKREGKNGTRSSSLPLP